MAAPKPAKTNALRLLDAAGIPYAAHEYPVDDGAIDAVSIARKLGLPRERMFKTLVTRSAPREFHVFVVPSDAELDLKKAARAAGVKSIEMIHLRELFPLTGYVHGGCSPVGMKKPFPTFIDETAVLFDTIYVSAGKIGLSMELPPDVLAGFVGASFADLTRPAGG